MDQLRMRARLRRYSTPVPPSDGVRALSHYRPIAPKPPLPCVAESSSTISFQNTCVGPVMSALTHVASLFPRHQSIKKRRKRRNKNSQTHTPALKCPALLTPSSARERHEDLSGVRRGHAPVSFPMIFENDAEFMEKAAASASPSVLPLVDGKGKTMQSDMFGIVGYTFNVDDRSDASGSCILKMATRLKHNASCEIQFFKAPPPSRFDEEERDKAKDDVRRNSITLSFSPVQIEPSLISSNTNQPCTSIACLERIYDACLEPLELKYSSEHVESQLEASNLPGLIADLLNVVRWVNTAYKAMVGQPECPWLMSTVHSCSLTIAGAVLLSSNVDNPTSASSFSGRVNVKWTRRSSGHRTSMTLQCGVTASGTEHSRRMLAWQFDIHAGLGLTCPA
ncbi:hypothetical protein KP509_04G061400 [Ceratopteris richardii]|uniref:DUF7950 domain-containing protein n=1 Tax=Ceratopteris richardii TaxID=49495 RepID=A0A8T2UTB1_CERRI|nr:hypothetical protein KP509_04G061400 [Ceratopteris richardii]